MDSTKTCDRAEKCPLFTGILESNPLLIQTYKNLYCENGEAGRSRCKRYQVAMKAGSCPPYVLPNATISVDDIIKRMEKE